MKKRIGSLLLILALCFTLLPTAAFAAGDSGNTASTKKISVRMNAKNGKSTDSVSDGVSTAYGTTHTLTVTPQTGHYVIAGYFAGTDYYKTNPAKYQYSNMTLDKISEANPQTGAVQYQFTATEVIPISNDPNYDYICLYFHCAKLPTLLWTLGNISGEATAPSTDGNTAAIPYVSLKELCGDPNEYTGYYSLADKKDRPYLDWQVISITDKEGNTAGGTVAFDNNHLTYTPTADEAGKTVTITIRPKLGYVEEANTPLSFEIEVKKPVVEQSEFYVTMVTDGYGNAVAMPNSAKEGEEIQLTAIPDRGHHLKEWQATSGTSGKIMITNDKFTMPAGNVTVKAIFEADTYTVKLYANGGTIADGKNVTSYTYGEGATLPTADDMTYTEHTFKGWYDNEGLSGDPVTAIGDTETGDKEYWAKWEIHQYTITVKPENGKADITITQDYGTAITAPADPTREGYQFNGWDKAFPTTMPAENLTITAKWKVNSYTITFDTTGGSEIAPITQDYGTAIVAPADPTREGYTFIGWDMEIPTTMPAENITLKARWKDSEKPTGEIKISENSWKAFLNNITFGLFFKDTQTVTINAADNSGESVTVEYLLSNKELTKTELDGMTFTAYTAPFGIDPDNEYIIYVRLTDKAGNTDYICSDGIVLDGTSPVIKGIENGKTYCEAQTVTIDEKYIDTVIVNETKVTLDENNSFVLSPADDEQKIIVTDKAGNTAEMTVTVNDGHTFGEWASNGDGTHTRTCTVDGCSAGTQTENCIDANKDHKCDICDYIISECADDNKDHKCDYCGKKLTEHTGGKATCKDKAKCEVCGAEYGEFDANNHSDLKYIDAKAATKDAEGNIEYWYCEGCGKYFSDKDGTKEIKKADTVTAKLKDDSKSPQTGDTSNLALWIALLFVSGGAAIGTTVVSRKKKYNR